jgi:hypothetical protein
MVRARDARKNNTDMPRNRPLSAIMATLSGESVPGSRGFNIVPKASAMTPITRADADNGIQSHLMCEP